MDTPPPQHQGPNSAWLALRTALIYLVLGSAWILFSDRLLQGSVDDRAVLSRLSTYKGLFFIIATASLLFWLILRELSQAGRAEQSLREREEHYRTLFETLPVGVAVTDQAGNLIIYNYALLHASGYAPHDLARLKNLTRLLADTEESEQLIKTALAQGGLRPRDVLMRRKDGATYPAILSLSPILRQSQLCWQVVIEDTTQRRAAEQALRASEGQARRRLQDVLLLNRILHITVSAQDEHTVLEAACTELALALHVPHCAGALVNAERTRVTVIAEYREPAQPSSVGLSANISDPPVWQVVGLNQPLIVADIAAEPHLDILAPAQLSRSEKAQANLPILLHGQALGVLILADTQPRAWDMEQIALAQSVATAIGQAIKNAQLYAKLSEYATSLEKDLDENTRAS